MQLSSCSAVRLWVASPSGNTRSSKKERETALMATGLFVTEDGKVMVEYGTKKIPISEAQYKANGYKPPLRKLARGSLRSDSDPKFRQSSAAIKLR